MSGIPKLPEHVSNDGREIWDWAGRLGEWTARNQRRRDLQTAIVKIQSTCGSCELWMTPSCPREQHNNKTGQWQGPSMNGAICGKFAMKSWDAKRLEELKSELNRLAAPESDGEKGGAGVG
jgi:hypothetical protein